MRVPVLWGLLLMAIAAVEIVFGPNAAEIALLGGAGAAAVLAGLAMRERTEDVEALPSESLETVIAAVGFAIFVLGWEVGQWVMGVGAGIFVAGLIALARELVGQR